MRSTIQAKRTQAVFLAFTLLFGSWFLIFYFRHWADGNDLLTGVGEIAIGRAHWRDDWEETHLNHVQSPDFDDGEAKGNVIQHGSVSRQANPSLTTDAPQSGDKTSPTPAASWPPAELADTGEPSQLACPAPAGARYDHLRNTPTNRGPARFRANKIHYLFALNLHQSAEVMPRLLGSIVQAMEYLGPERCALSVVEGPSEDGTHEILARFQTEIELMGSHFYLNTSSLDPKAPGSKRIETLAELRNMVLAPLRRGPDRHKFSSESIVIFLDEIALCPEDILELLHQHVTQSAHMTCAFDWIFEGSTFNNVWVSRSMAGDLFFEIPHDGSWAYKDDLFWDDPSSRERYESKLPLQVYSCWGGMVTIDAQPFARGKLRFRSSEEGECVMGEATLLAKDMWRQEMGKIMAVPTVNVGYSDHECSKTKERRGYVHDHVDMTSSVDTPEEMIDWQTRPPGMVKCLPDWNQPSWVEPV
ncbi:hypothetical protein VTN77DRAFT_6395 [Rasamsonia byssochlamydoides]|uniref:uncharacterized protein n=1 Tax=Rasamsonia byssochlamydoides TaxID=89139 RepID=UPI0037438703